MKNTGFKIDATKLKARIKRWSENVSASSFEPELREYLRRTLKSASQATPTRNLALIKANQKKQYALRVNYIPSNHWPDADPRLVATSGGEWIFCNGKWYNASWKLPPEVWDAYVTLESERMRRLEMSESAFIKERAQARYLYRRSWWEIGQSVSIDIGATNPVLEAHSRHNPPKAPPKGYAQLRGGKDTLSFAIYNPFLAIPSVYLTFDPGQILQDAAAKHRTNFLNACGRKLRELVPKE